MNKQDRDDLIRQTIFDHLNLKKSNGFCTYKDLKQTHSIRDDLGADSLDRIELIMMFEELFDIGIDDTEAEKIKTVGDVCRYLEVNDRVSFPEPAKKGEKNTMEKSIKKLLAYCKENNVEIGITNKKVGVWTRDDFSLCIPDIEPEEVENAVLAIQLMRASGWRQIG